VIPVNSEFDSRQHPDRPVVGVGVVVWRGDKFLLVKRGKEPNKGQWSIPGGAQQLGETVYAAAAREVREETGLDIKVRCLVDVVDGIMRDDQDEVLYHYTLVDVLAESLEGDPVAADDAAAVGWFTLDDLQGLRLWSETERIIRESAEKRS
jgi:ADP-ribose pyrophosphatase YjhB (NUDIX family)